MFYTENEPLESASVTVSFKDCDTAWNVLQDKVDAHAEVGLGNIVVDGYSPLADHLGKLLERIPLYLPR